MHASSHSALSSCTPFFHPHPIVVVNEYIRNLDLRVIYSPFEEREWRIVLFTTRLQDIRLQSPFSQTRGKSERAKRARSACSVSNLLSRAGGCSSGRKPLEERPTLLERLVADPASKHVERDLGLVVRDHVARLVNLEVPEQAGAAVEGDGLRRTGALAVRLEGEELGLLVLGGLGPVEGEGPREVTPGEIGRSAIFTFSRRRRLRLETHLLLHIKSAEPAQKKQKSIRRWSHASQTRVTHRRRSGSGCRPQAEAG